MRLQLPDDTTIINDVDNRLLLSLPKEEEISKPDDVVISKNLEKMAYIYKNDSMII
jgi:hypothetical protein